MTMKTGAVRNQLLKIRYSEEEFVRLKMHFARGNTRNLNAYVRKVSLQEPVEFVVRNGSFDSFIDEIVALRKEMTATRQHFTLTTEQKERLVQIHEEIRLLVNKIAKLCIQK